MSDIQSSAKKLLERNRVGALLRVFSLTPEVVDFQVASALTAVRALRALSIGERKVFSRIDLLVPNDQEFEDSDCGLTAERLRTAVKTEFPGESIFVLEISRGDIYCMLLDYGVANQLEDRIAYSLIMSHGLVSYASLENITGLLSAMQQQARVAGLAISELKSLVEAGRVANSFAMWHNKSLSTVGGFDLRAQKPTKARAHIHEYVHDPLDASVRYAVAGCEEIIPSIRLARFFGPSIAVIEPQGRGGAWHVPTESEDPATYKRHQAKLRTMALRQERMAEKEGLDIKWLQESIIR